MTNKIIFEDEICLWWDRLTQLPEKGKYAVFLDDVLQGTTPTTHFEMYNVLPKTSYLVRLEMWDEADNSLCVLEETTVVTPEKKEKLDVTKAPYFAKGDGVTMNTSALQKAFDDCRENQAVYFPAGVFLTGSLRLHSDMELYLDEGATLQGSEKVEDYLPKIKSRFEGTEMMCYSSLLNMGEMDNNAGYNCKNVILRGKGTICGGGKALLQNTVDVEFALREEELAPLKGTMDEFIRTNVLPGRARGRLVNVSNSENVIMSGLTFKNGPAWNVHMIYSNQIVTKNCKFFSHGVHNGDGWDPDSSTNCTLFGIYFCTGDDCVAIKSGKNPEGNIINKPCENIRVFDCYAENGHSCSIGSEMSGGVNNVWFWDCDFRNTCFGIQVKGTKKRGAYVTNLEVYNCISPRILVWAVGYNDDGDSAGCPPIFKNYRFEKLTLTCKIVIKCDEPPVCPAIDLIGFDENEYAISNVYFKDITIQRQEVQPTQMIDIKYVKNVTFENITCD